MKISRLKALFLVCFIFNVPVNGVGGSLTPPDNPGPTMHSLEDIYNLVDKAYSHLSAPPAPVAVTGQQESSEPGDDGALKSGVPFPDPRFTVNGNGTITDNLTGLVWLQDISDTILFGKKSLTDAIAICSSLKSGDAGLSDGSVAGDWRLPSIRELESLTDFNFNNDYDANAPSGNNLALPKDWDSFFSGINEGFFQSSTVRAISVANVWGVDMGTGAVVSRWRYENPNSPEAHLFYFWPVRDSRD